MQREAKESIERQRIHMISALYANTNWDQKDADREARLKDLNDHFNEAIEYVYFPERRKGPDIDWDNPFYAAAKRGLARTRAMLGLDSEDANQSVQDVVDLQAERERRDRQVADSIKGIDQLS